MRAEKGLPKWTIPALIVMAIGTVWVRLTIVKTTYAINQSSQEIHALQQAKEQMELRATALRSPRRLEAIAKSKFGLTQPRSEQIIHISETESAKRN